MNFLSSINFRLVLTVVVTSLISFAALWLITNNRLHHGLSEQGKAVTHLSANLLRERFHGEVHLARDQMDRLAQEFEKSVASIALRANVSKAVASNNDVAIRTSLNNAVKNTEIDRLIAIDEKGKGVGASFETNLFQLTTALNQNNFSKELKSIVSDNSRAKPRTYFVLGEVHGDFVKAIGGGEKAQFGYVSIVPVFDDFGETVGGLLGVRLIKFDEALLKKFASLAKSDIILMSNRTIIARTDDNKITNLKVVHFHKPANDEQEFVLTRTNDELYTAHCGPYHALSICITGGTSEVVKLSDSLLEVGRQQTSSLQAILFFVMTATLLSLVTVLFFAVKHTMQGLPQLSLAAIDVSNGNLNVPFKPAGVGEVRELSIAFERMLSNLRKSTHKVHQLAYYDSVTGLANREKLQEEARKLLVPHAQGAAVMMMVDITRFQSINDNYGMKMGDYVLHKMGERLAHAFKFFESHKRIEQFTVARTGGDNFVILFKTNSSKDDLYKLAEIIIGALANPLKIGSSQVVIDSKIGISLFPQDGEHFDDMMAHTVLALNHVTDKSIEKIIFYNPEFSKAAFERQELESELREALKNKSLMVYYQPKLSCDDGLVHGSEALVRWIHPTKGFISPAKFIPIAEEAGLIGDVGRFVLERAIDETAILLGEGHDICVSVNVSALQLDDPSFADEVLALVDAKKFPTRSLELEITESMAMSDPEGVKERIARLRARGIRFSMDDFGTGYSNLSQLASMPIDILKLDRSLIMKVQDDPQKQALARSILALAREYGFKTVVEGVEDVGELGFCLRHEADYIQGFVFSGAVTLEKFRPFLVKDKLGATPFTAKYKEAGGGRIYRHLKPLARIESPKLGDVPIA